MIERGSLLHINIVFDKDGGGASQLPSRVFQKKKPKDGENYTWVPLRSGNPDKPQQRVGWLKIFKGEPPAFDEIELQQPQQRPLPGINGQ